MHEVLIVRWLKSYQRCDIGSVNVYKDLEKTLVSILDGTRDMKSPLQRHNIKTDTIVTLASQNM